MQSSWGAPEAAGSGGGECGEGSGSRKLQPPRSPFNGVDRSGSRTVPEEPDPHTPSRDLWRVDVGSRSPSWPVLPLIYVMGL